ncbi:MAG: SufE family protein [Chthonomonas sp.]|nr:SufE family protein [Chthonomonas sp.]
MSTPARLREAIDDLNFFEDRSERIQALIDLANQWQGVPESVAARPYDRNHQVHGCESEVYVFAVGDANQVQFHVAVENPQGMSAMAMAALLTQTINGLSAADIAAIDENIVYEVFGRELSMGKSMGLMGMIRLMKALAANLKTG